MNRLHILNRFTWTSLFIWLTSHLSANPDSLQISLLSCSPGAELYSTFGHSALRVRDFAAGKDIIFNYGTFNFREKNFYLKFMQGKLKYLLSVESYDDFLYNYFLENRTVYEQIFNLTLDQKSQLYEDLKINALPANRAYKYDFFWDNCSTRIRDKMEFIYHQAIQYPDSIGHTEITFRDYLHKYLGTQPWSRFGIDLILGLPADAIASTRNAMFLPLEMMNIYDSTISNNLATNSKSNIIQSPNPVQQKRIWFTPFLICSLLLCLVLMIRFYFNESVFSKFIFSLIMILTGIGGLIIFFLWFVSEHTATDNNLHLIWANPLLFLYPFRKSIFKANLLKWLSRLFTILLVFLIISFPLSPQAMPLTCLLIWIILLIIVVPDAHFNLSKKSI